MWNWLKQGKMIDLSPLDGYTLWAETYSKESNPIKDLSNKSVEEFLPDLANKSILDAGCGTGHFCAMAISKGAKRIVGVDFTEAMIDQAKKNCPAAEIFSADISNLNLEPNSFDVLICALVLGHIQNIIPVLSGFAQIMKPTGELILTDFHPDLTLKNSKRTFKDVKSSNTIAIQHFLHPLNKITDDLQSTGFSIEQMEEPIWNNMPVIYAIKARKK